MHIICYVITYYENIVNLVQIAFTHKCTFQTQNNYDHYTNRDYMNGLIALFMEITTKIENNGTNMLK